MLDQFAKATDLTISEEGMSAVSQILEHEVAMSSSKLLKDMG